MAGKTISVRLDMDTYKKLLEIKKARGISESDAVRQSIKGTMCVYAEATKDAKVRSFENLAGKIKIGDR